LKQTTPSGPDSSAVRVALWRALHVLADPPPHVISDEVGFKLAAPEADWRDRPDMNPQFTKTFRASIVARARYLDDLVVEQSGRGVGQYVILGAGLDSFAQRKAGAAPQMKVFEVDRPGPQAWKQKRLVETGLGISDNLKFVPVDFEGGGDWMEGLNAAGFDPTRPTVVSSTGVIMYLTRDAITSTLRKLAVFAPGSTLAMSYILPIEMAQPAERVGFEAAARGAKASGTPFLSFFSPEEIMALAREAGFKEVRNVSADDLAQRYFSGRTDGLKTSGSEQILVAKAGGKGIR
jgi:methyltransferase (TIGR00027 family)